MTSVINGSAAPRSRQHPSEFRRNRKIARNARLYQQVYDLVAAYTQAKYLGVNTAVERMAINHGFEPHELCIVDVILSAKVVTIICVPHGLWSRDEHAKRLLSFRSHVRAVGFAAVLVPQAIVERQPRLGNASILGASRRVHMNATERMTVISYIIENGDCTLSDLAELLEHRDPYGAILSLAAMGVVKIDLSRCISPTSLVSLPDPRTELKQWGGY